MRKRKSLLINPHFQWSLIGYSASSAIFVLLSVYGLLKYSFHFFREVGSKAGLNGNNLYFEFINMQEASLFRILLVIALVIFTVLIVGGIYLSHKIAGPVYRMKKELLEMAQTRPEKIRKINFRKGDYFPELADAFNQFVDSRETKGESNEKLPTQ